MSAVLFLVCFFRCSLCRKWPCNIACMGPILLQPELSQWKLNVVVKAPLPACFYTKELVLYLWAPEVRFMGSFFMLCCIRRSIKKAYRITFPLPPNAWPWEQEVCNTLKVSLEWCLVFFYIVCSVSCVLADKGKLAGLYSDRFVFLCKGLVTWSYCLPQL